MRKFVAVMMMTMLAVAMATAQGATTKPETKEAPSVAGAWSLTIESPHGAMVMKLNLKLDGKKLTGTMSNDMMGEHTVSGEVTDGKIMFRLTAEGPGDMEFNGKL
jgi:hypothetical protein